MEQTNKSIWDEVLDKTDIVNVISEYISVTKQGKNFRACCPFHDEKTASFMINPQKNIFKCFGCGKGGNAIKFLEEYKHIKPLEALEILATKASMDISEYTNRFKSSETPLEIQRQYALYNDANTLFKYQRIMNKDKSLENFINARKLDDAIIQKFEIGLCDSKYDVYKRLKMQGYTDDELTQSGLFTIKDNHIYNFFVDRVTFPIKNEKGQVVGFSARDYKNQFSNKYLNSPESEIFIKSNTLFNYSNAQATIDKTNEVYLVEGQFDAIALTKANVNNVVALMGTSLSKEHLHLLKNKTINLFFDNDNAGKNATIKNASIILENAKLLNLKVNVISNNTQFKDADELYNNDLLTETLQNKQDIVKFVEINLIANANALPIDEKSEKYQQAFSLYAKLDDAKKIFFKKQMIKDKYLDAKEFETLERQYNKFVNKLTPNQSNQIKERELNMPRTTKKVEINETKLKKETTKYESKNVKSIAFADENGVKQGIEKFYEDNERKILFAELPYIDGKINGQAIYYENGKPISKTTYKNGVIDGLAQTFYENGKLKTESILKNNHLNGIKKNYTDDGILVSETNFKNDLKVGKETLFYADGKIKEEVIYGDNCVMLSQTKYSKKGEITSSWKAETEPKDVASNVPVANETNASEAKPNEAKVDGNLVKEMPKQELTNLLQSKTKTPLLKKFQDGLKITAKGIANLATAGVLFAIGGLPAIAAFALIKFLSAKTNKEKVINPSQNSELALNNLATAEYNKEQQALVKNISEIKEEIKANNTQSTKQIENLTNTLENLKENVNEKVFKSANYKGKAYDIKEINRVKPKVVAQLSNTNEQNQNNTLKH